jgi:protein TonB
MDRQTGPPPPLFTKREKYGLALLTLSFIVASALVHVIIGSIGSGLFPHSEHAAAAPPEPFVIYKFTRETPTPTPVPTPHILATAVPHSQQTHAPSSRPPVRPPHPSADSTRTPSSDRVFPTGPPVTPSPTDRPVVTPSSSPAASPDAQRIVDGDFIRTVTPDYPAIARDANIEGSVTVRVTIGPDGRVENAVVVQSSGNAALDDAALKAARESLYRAPTLDGQPTTRDYLIVYTFSLDA